MLTQIRLVGLLNRTCSSVPDYLSSLIDVFQRLSDRIGRSLRCVSFNDTHSIRIAQFLFLISKTRIVQPYVEYNLIAIF